MKFLKLVVFNWSLPVVYSSIPTIYPVKADIKPTPAWPVCDAGDLATVTTNPPHGYTDADATFIWVTIYLVLAIFWALSAVPLLLGEQEEYFDLRMTILRLCGQQIRSGIKENEKL